MLAVACYLEGGSSPQVWGVVYGVGDRQVTKAVHPHRCGEWQLQGKRRGKELRFIPTGVGSG